MNVAECICVSASALCFYVAAHTARAARVERWSDQRWFALTALTAGLYIILDLPNFQPTSLFWAVELERLQLLVAAAHVLCWLIFSNRVVGRAWGAADRAVLVGLSVCAALNLVPGWVYLDLPETSYALPRFGTVVYQVQTGPLAPLVYAAILGSLAVPLIRFLRARRAHPEGRWYALGLGILLACGVNDALLGIHLYQGPFLLHLGFMLPIASAAVVQTDRLVNTARALDQLSAHLERQVHERSLALVQARQSLDRSERLAAIGQLAAGVAHEVNNPAAALQANLGYLREALGGGQVADLGEVRACLDESLASVKRIAHIVRQLRDSARAAANPCQSEAVELAEAIASASAAARPHLPADCLAVEVEPRLQAGGNEGYLVQVLTNLLVNAAQATRPGERPRVTVRARSHQGGVMLEVVDQGAGMSPEVRQRLFEPFFTTKPVGQGTGLGLAVSRGLVQRMGGTLELESAPGAGTTARITLGPAPAQPARPASRAVAIAAPRRRLVLIDDDPEVRHALVRQLGQRFEIETASGVQDGLVRVVSSPPPDLVLCDVVMADGGGPRLYQLLAAAHPELARKLVFLTGGAITSEDERFLAQQPQPVLLKPVELSAVVQVAEQVAG